MLHSQHGKQIPQTRTQTVKSSNQNTMTNLQTALQSSANASPGMEVTQHRRNQPVVS